MRRKFLLPATALALLAGAWASVLSAPISSTIWQILVQTGVASGTAVDSTIHPVVIASGSVFPSYTVNGKEIINNQVNDTSYGLDIFYNALHAAPSNDITLEGSAASNAWHIQVDSVANGGGLYLSSDLATNSTTGALSCYPISGKPDLCQMQTNDIDVYDVDEAKYTVLRSVATGASTNRNFNLPAVQGTLGQSLTFGTNGTASMVWTSTSDHFGASGLLGGLASTAAATLLQSCIVAPRAGHFTTLDCTTDFLTACTTAPAFNVRNNTAATVGATPLSCGTGAGAVTQAETLAFAAGATICITRTTNGSTCAVPFFAVNATVTYP